MKNNIEMFDEYAAKIFDQLYRSFPVPIVLKCTEVCGDTELDEFGRVLGIDGEPSKPFEICFGTVQWLQESGYLRTERSDNYCFYRCVLSAKSLEVLKSTPESIKVKTSLGESLAGAMRKGSMDVAIQLSNEAIKIGAGMLMGVR
ncbi:MULTISPECIES: hypothetical protein [unclassified Vibrio]|uniref:hypothetical protein n=1 Tax=unclassified Vibrio TaxID=2614977 RepID=UPI000B8E9862|nr:MULTISPECIES: hypothetical protein [unclassified Vibrio]NAW99991.1 hypothetical protein [Vibrio sp. V23_P3S9T160]OXX45364.1 hypothetical protein B9J85_07490 [Vibrio sp. V11_P1A41T118]